MTGKEIIERYETTNEFTSSEIQEILWEQEDDIYTVADEILGEERWINIKRTIIKIGTRYFAVYWYEGKTEMQESEYLEGGIEEVFLRRVVVKDYFTKADIESGQHEFI